MQPHQRAPQLACARKHTPPSLPPPSYPTTHFQQLPFVAIALGLFLLLTSQSRGFAMASNNNTPQAIMKTLMGQAAHETEQNGPRMAADMFIWMWSQTLEWRLMPWRKASDRYSSARCRSQYEANKSWKLVASVLLAMQSWYDPNMVRGTVGFVVISTFIYVVGTKPCIPQPILIKLWCLPNTLIGYIRSSVEQGGH